MAASTDAARELIDLVADVMDDALVGAESEAGIRAAHSSGLTLLNAYSRMNPQQSFAVQQAYRYLNLRTSAAIDGWEFP